jgi:hypothetical protein
MSEDIFESSTRSAGDFAGVFESDDETSYFYLCEVHGSEIRILDHAHICSGVPDFTASSISIRWSTAEDKVALYIDDVLRAAFDVARPLRSS